MLTYSQTWPETRRSAALSPAFVTAPATSIAATTAMNAQNSVVLNACLVSVLRRRPPVRTGPPERTPVVWTSVAMKHSFVGMRLPASPAAPDRQRGVSDRAHLDPVAERVGRVEAPHPWDRVVPDDLDAGVAQARGERVEVVGAQCRVRLARRCERLLDPDVQLLRVAAGEPDPPAGAQRRRLLQLRQPEQAAVEPPRLVLAAGRGGELDVVDPVDAQEDADSGTGVRSERRVASPPWRTISSARPARVIGTKRTSRRAST